MKGRVARGAVALIAAASVAIGPDRVLRAQTDESPEPPATTVPDTTTTTPTTASPTTTTTTTAPPADEGAGEESPAPAADPAPARPRRGSEAPPPAPPPPAVGGDAVDPGGAPRVVPPEYQALIRSVRRSKPNDSARLLEALRPLTALGLTSQEAAQIGMGRFPVAGHARFSDDWWFPRFVPRFHLHEGTDIFAAMGTPVRSPADGVLRQTNGAVGGLAVYVTQDDGTYFYLAHLAAFVKGQSDGQRVKVGDIVGFVGDSGNAKGGPPHVHFEVHPAPVRTITRGRGKDRKVEVIPQRVPPGTRLPPTNPKPYLDAWLAEALADVPRVVSAYTVGRPRVVVATGMTRRFSPGTSTASRVATPPRSDLLWASSANPAGGALALAEAEAAQVAAAVDWEERALEEQRRAEAGQNGGGENGGVGNREEAGPDRRPWRPWGDPLSPRRERSGPSP